MSAIPADKTDGWRTPPEIYEHGQKLVAIGTLLMDRRTSLCELAHAALDCGMRLQFGFASTETET